MQFTSINFLLFAALVLLGYYLVPKGIQWIWLLIASYAFCLWAGAAYWMFLLFSTAATYLCARAIGKNLEAHQGTLSSEEGKNAKARMKRKNRVWLMGGLAANFGLLALCKAVLVEPFRTMAQGTGLHFLTLGLPMGISFYLFQSTGYLIDVYRGTVQAERNIFRFALFVSFFPQLAQGPISKFTQLAPSLYASHEFHRKTVCFGLQRMLWGCFKKLVVADRIAVAVAELQGPADIGVAFWVLSLFYAVQIYGDFTGGIDMAMGLAEAMGIPLPENFLRPYFSKNIAEYWRRWHISLGEWMKNYIFYPISVSGPLRALSKIARAKFGKFGKRLPVYAAAMVTWACTGIWHGLTPNFLVWGLLNGFLIVGSEELAPLYAKFHHRFHLKERAWYGAFETVRMFLLMNLIRVCDLFPQVGDYFVRLGSLVTTCNFHILWDGTLMKLGLTALDYGILILGIGVMFAVSLIQEKKGSVRALLWRSNGLMREVLFFALFLAVLLLGSYGIGYDAVSFIYNQF